MDRSTKRQRVVTVCGGGNAGHALSVVLSQNFDGAVNWLVGSEEKADLLRRGARSADGLQSTGVIKARADKLQTISSDPAQVIPDADLVMIVVPAFVHAAVLTRIKPYIAEATTIGCLPTRGGFEFEALSGVDLGRLPRVFGLQTLPWSTRVVSPGQVVNVGAAKATVVMGALPPDDGPKLAGELSTMLGTQVVATSGFVSLTLGNPGQYIHPGLMYGHFRSWQGEEFNEDNIPMFYAEATDEMGKIVEQLSFDAGAVARAIEFESGGALDLTGVVPVLNWLRASYSHVTADQTSVATCFRTGPIQARKAPVTEVSPGRFVPNFDYRYLTEDVPYGLVVTRAFAEIANVPTPTIDDVISWSQSKMQKVYLADGRLEGPDTRELPIPQNHGVSTFRDLIEWYADHSTTNPRRSQTEPAPSS
jgi:hypothetical protein